jgi:hypothetical protein
VGAVQLRSTEAQLTTRCAGWAAHHITGPKHDLNEVNSSVRRFTVSKGRRALCIVMSVLLLASATAVAAQPAPWRLVQANDGTLYLLAEGQRFTLDPDPISDDEVANLPDGGHIGSVLLAAAPVAGTGASPGSTTPVAQTTPGSTGTPASTATAAAVPTTQEGAGAGTRQNPVRVSTAASLADAWQLAVTSSEPDATSRVVATDPGNVAPPSGYQFYLANISVTNTSTAARIFQARMRLRAVGPASVPYFAIENACGVIPNPFAETLISPGATLMGKLCWTVQSRDAAALVMYDVPQVTDANADTTRIYFALHS